MTPIYHAFVVMPFGTKPGPDGKPIDFNRVYSEYLQPALEQAGVRPFRADEELRAGDIERDMFQELLVADLVVAELTLDNPNVWYELGVRHALRKGGVVLVQGARAYQPFDIYTDRKLTYSLKDGAPDPATLRQDIDQLVAMIKATLEAWHEDRVSPVYALLRELREPSWRALLLSGNSEFTSRIKAWWERIENAHRDQRPGDIVVLADEAPSHVARVEAKIEAGKSLLTLRQFRLALEQFEEALAVDPTHVGAQQKRAICLERLQRFEDARAAAQWEPRHVFLFSGHMVDAPGRTTPRFPAAQVPVAQRAIEQTLEALGAGASDVAISSGACGGDLLFAQACLARGVASQVYLPFTEPEFLKNSVTFAGDAWRTAFYNVKRNPKTTALVMPERLGPLPTGRDAYERVNLWQLHTALSYGPDKVHFICLWNGGGGDGPGGTQHMVQEVERHTGQVHWLDTRKLWQV